MGEMPGYRFYPTEEELVSFYLYNKLEEKDSNISRVIPAVDIYAFEPWQLPEQCGDLCHGDTEQWFFFVPRQEREVRGGKPSRTTASGYWKATCSPSYVHSSDGKVIGVKKSMVFYKGKTPSGTKTKWKMNEYRAIKEDLPTSTPTLRNELSLCRIYVVSGSFGAFDRRPAGNEASSSQSIIMKNTQESDDKFNASENKNNTATTTSMEESCSSGCTSFSEENKLSVLWRMQDLGDDEMSVEFIKKNI